MRMWHETISDRFYYRLTGPHPWPATPWHHPAITELRDRDSHHQQQLATTSIATASTPVLTEAHGNNKQQHRDQTEVSSQRGRLLRLMRLLAHTGELTSRDLRKIQKCIKNFLESAFDLRTLKTPCLYQGWHGLIHPDFIHLDLSG